MIKHIFTPRLNLWDIFGFVVTSMCLDAGMYIAGPLCLLVTILISVYAEQQLKGE